MASNAKNLAELLNQDSTVAVGDIADGSVTTAKLAADAVTAAKLADNAVVIANISSGTLEGSGVNLGRRRLNPNGAMLVAQRGTSKATLTDGYNCLDRVRTYKAHDGVVEESQSTDTPNSEFYNSLKHRVTTADTSIASNQYHALSFRLEGNSVTHLGFGASGAKKVTISFWVKSSVAGAYGTCLRNLASNRFNMQTMTINSADTWEKKSITYTGDTSGTWPKDNTEGLQFQLSMAMGDLYHGTSADTWVTNVDVSPSNQVNWLATVGNTFYLTGLQIEEGETATEFEHLSLAEELQLCKRYFQNIGADGTPNAGFNYNGLPMFTCHWPVEMRAAPTGSVQGTGSAYSSTNASGQTNYTGSTTSNLNIYLKSNRNYLTGGSWSGSGNDRGNALLGNQNIDFDAEL